MAKQLIIQAMEEVVGEYVLNMTEENVKIAALRGKIKLENVQLDGDLIGSHVLGAVGLSGFGILSCWARSVKISVPFKNLEQEATRIEIRGVHLICVPLMPSTANKMYGSGTSIDPSCRLRTRAKRSILARLERNYLSGRLLGEEPIAQRIRRAVRDVEKGLRKMKNRKRGQSKSTEDEEIMDSLVAELNDDINDNSGSEEKSTKDASISAEGLPELPRDWKVKFREKIMRNLEISINDMHIRCEVSEGGLEFCHPDHRKVRHLRKSYSANLPPDLRSFSFGFTIDSFVVNTANEKWNAGKHEGNKSRNDSSNDHLGPNKYQTKNNKLGVLKNIKMYWDDEPPFLLSETDLLKANNKKLSPEKIQSLIAAAMDAMFHQQEPGRTIRTSLSETITNDIDEERPHQFVSEPLFLKVRVRMSDRTLPGPISCSLEFLPFNLSLQIRSHQYVQYQRLKTAMLSLQRFDTMLRQRPASSPMKNPQAWWKYAIACVISRPNSRPWSDVSQIVKCRNRYIDLVVKKLLEPKARSGFHGNLSDEESNELLSFEDLLPIEALTAFHLISLRTIYYLKQSSHPERGIPLTHKGKGGSPTKERSKTRSSNSFADLLTGRGKNKAGKGRFRFLKPKKYGEHSGTDGDDETVMRSLLPGDLSLHSSAIFPQSDQDPTSLLEAMTLRLGTKTWFVAFKFVDATANLTLLRASDDASIARLAVRSSVIARSFGRGKRDFFFDITTFEVFDHRNADRQGQQSGSEIILSVRPENGDDEEIKTQRNESVKDPAISSLDSELFTESSDNLIVSGFLELPPPGVVCRIAASRGMGSVKLSVSAHPATLVWTTPCLDAVAEFFVPHSVEMQMDLTQHLRNAATPLARKAQLALLSPSSVALHVNIAAPKVWVPISSSGEDGALFLDAGMFKMASSKNEGETDMNFDIHANDIQVKFVRGQVMPLLHERIENPFSFGVLETTSSESCIVRPFHVRLVSTDNYTSHNREVPKVNDRYDKTIGTINRRIDVSVSPICFNFVDAEILARAIGKWYAQGLLNLNQRVSTKRRTKVKPSTENGTATHNYQDKPESDGMKNVEQSYIEQILSVKVDKIEMALEGHSKGAFSDDRSLASHDTYHALSPVTRIYVVEVFAIGVQRSRINNTTKTEFNVADASIVQLKGEFSYVPMKMRHEASESQHCILVGLNSARRMSALNSNGHKSSLQGIPDSSHGEIVCATLFHDSVAHLDEIEIDIDSVIVRVTPTSLKDFMKGLKRILELVQLMTKEMERKVHEEGRKARERDRKAVEGEIPHQDSFSICGQPLSPSGSESYTEFSDARSSKLHSDSCILFRVTLRESTLLAGRPTSTSNVKKNKTKFQRRQKTSFAVIQVLSNALIMFQSVENPDTSGSKTLHISVDSLSASVNTEFERIPTSEVPPMIGPTGAEFRVVYATENFGCVVSQDISLDCEVLKSCLTPNDISILVNISRKMLERLRGFGVNYQQQSSTEKDFPRQTAPSLIRYQKKGTGIATQIRAEIHTFSFVLLRAFRSKYGATELLDFNVTQLKGKLEGCLSALSGECTSCLAVNFFNSEVSDWEYAVEPFDVVLAVDQMPNELVLNLSPRNPIQINLTGIFLRDFAEMDFDVLRGRKDDGKKNDLESKVLTPSVLSTVGLRRATESHSVMIQNCTGLDFYITPSSSFSSPSPAPSVRFKSIGTGLLEDGCITALDSIVSSDFSNGTSQAPTFCLNLAPSSIKEVGERETVFDLPIETSPGRSLHLRVLIPSSAPEGCYTSEIGLDRSASGMTSPGILQTEESYLNNAFYHAEPVVEWCMQNQRLRSSTVDVFSLQKGRDLLSSSVWSPEDGNNVDTIDFSHYNGIEAPVEPLETNTNDMFLLVTGPDMNSKSSTSRAPYKSNWLRPYLKSDSPEWTDMTCILRMARERVMLPDSRWIWVNDWTVDLSGKFGESTDADGWEYEADFETFTRRRRYYVRGDSCRRRRWTRTRTVRPPKLQDPLRRLQFVWETSRDENGNYSMVVRSPLKIHNATASPMTFFVFSPSWDDEKKVGTALPGKEINVPVSLASAAYIRLARKFSKESSSIEDYIKSERVMILPTSPTSSVILRTTMHLDDVSNTTLNFLINVKSNKGIIDIFIEPVLTVVNLLPCQLQCQLGEVLRSTDSRIADSRPVIGSRGKIIGKAETIEVASGKEGKCTAVNPSSKPHISLKVPGYLWSPWQRIVNRKANSHSWRPSEDEEDWHTSSSKVDADYAEEYKSLVRFERIGTFGDPLILIISVECGHTPTVRVYSQYWILDKTGFGCRFCDGFTDMLGTIPDEETSRRSHLLPEDGRGPRMQNDMKVLGHQWSIGMSGMSLYFSQREKFALAIETGAEDGRYTKKKKKVKSKWVSPMDVSNVIPKTVFSVDELGGQHRFELAISVMVCPGIFARTKLITLLPRYEIVNLLHRELVVAQHGCLDAETVIPSQASVPFHWERQSQEPKIHLGTPSVEEKDNRIYSNCWSNGCIQVDKIGITSMRLPTEGTFAAKPMVVQAEVRLATKDQSSAVVVVIWSANEKSNPLYILRNRTSHTILCRQPLQDEPSELEEQGDQFLTLETCSGNNAEGAKNKQQQNGFECGAELGPYIRSFLGLDRIEEFVWIMRSGGVTCFGFDDPEKPHILEWTCVNNSSPRFDEGDKKAFLEVDAMGSLSLLKFTDGKEICCQIGAEHSTKVIEFFEIGPSRSSTSTLNPSMLRKRGIDHQMMVKAGVVDAGVEIGEEDENIAFSLKIDIPILIISVVDNVDQTSHGREILSAHMDNIFFAFSQSREGYHEFELRLMSFQVDNHVLKSIHPVLIFCPRPNENEPFLHMSAVRRLQQHSSTFVFRYAAIRVLEIDIYLDRRTAEMIAMFIEPITIRKEEANEQPPDWVSDLTSRMGQKFAKPDRRAPRDIEKMIHTANSGRIFFEQLHLHPVRLALTFTQEWMEWNAGSESMMLFQFIRGMASIANAPLTFTSFVVSHVFEAPQALIRVIATHYSSQLTKQVFGILGSLAILGAPADFISNVGTGVRDFFYEPIQGAVHGPRQFIEGLEAGTQSLARGVFVGVVRGAANVTEVVNANLAGLTADDDFIDERKAHQRMLTDAMSRGVTARTFADSLYLAGASVIRGVKSGALGIVEQPTMYASKHGPVGFVKGIGKAFVGAVVKPVVGVGDAAVLVMNHVSDATSNKQIMPKIPKRLRRALPSRAAEKPHCVKLLPYDERAAKAQKIVTGGESIDDIYIGHVNIPSHLIIASEQCLWAIDRRTREPWCVSWEEISHFGIIDVGMRVDIFSQTGLKSYIFQVEDSVESEEFHDLLSMQLRKMGNSSSDLAELNSAMLNGGMENLFRPQLSGVKRQQVSHIFGSCNKTRTRLSNSVKDEIDLIEQCFARVKAMNSSTSTFFKILDEEAWALVSCWGQVFSGLSSRRCIVASIINGTGAAIQIKSTKLVEGGSPCYSIPTREFNSEQGILLAGGAIIFFGWGVVPNLLQAGNVFMHIETNAFICDLSDQKSRATNYEAMPEYQVGFLEKSYDDSGWWAKYWLLVRKKKEKK